MASDPLAGMLPVDHPSRSSTRGFYIFNSNTINAKVKQPGGATFTIPPDTWSQVFTVEGGYDITVLDAVTQFTVLFSSGGLNVQAGTGQGNYKVYADLF